MVGQEKAVDLLREQERSLTELSNKQGLQLKFKVNGVLVDVVDDNEVPFTIQDLENTSYTALVSDGSSDHQVKVDISE